MNLSGGDRFSDSVLITSMPRTQVLTNPSKQPCVQKRITEEFQIAKWPTVNACVSLLQPQSNWNGLRLGTKRVFYGAYELLAIQNSHKGRFNTLACLLTLRLCRALHVIYNQFDALKICYRWLPWRNHINQVLQSLFEYICLVRVFWDLKQSALWPLGTFQPWHIVE